MWIKTNDHLSYLLGFGERWTHGPRAPVDVVNIGPHRPALNYWVRIHLECLTSWPHTLWGSTEGHATVYRTENVNDDGTNTADELVCCLTDDTNTAGELVCCLTDDDTNTADEF